MFCSPLDDLASAGVTCTVTLDPTGYRVNDPAALARCAHQDGTDG
jgi:hypothetical protein